MSEEEVKKEIKSKLSKKYHLRPRSSKATNEKNNEKIRPAPLSRYRRKNANARERRRMQDLNDAFTNLYKAIPGHVKAIACSIQPAPGDKTSKIDILRLAIDYIASLDTILRLDDLLDMSEIEASGDDNNSHSCGSSSGTIIDSDDFLRLDDDFLSDDFDIDLPSVLDCDFFVK